MVSICFRLDDASARSDHNLENKVFDLFARLEIPLCVAVIPFAGAIGEPVAVSAQNCPHLFDAARAGVVEIALHGHSHRRRGNDARGRRTEFSGLPQADQSRLIREALEHVTSAFGRRIQGFVPPWNTYDASTMRVLAELGFEFLSAGTDVHRFGQSRPIVVPFTSLLGGARIAIQRARSFEWLAPVVVVLFHLDDFIEFRNPPRHDERPSITNLRDLEGLLRWIKENPRVRAETLSQVAKSSTNESNLQSVSELSLPYRIKSLVSPMLVRSPAWKTLPGVLWGMARTKARVGAKNEPGLVALDIGDEKRL